MGEQVVVSLGVEDLERAKQFYADGLGLEEEQDGGFFVSFKHHNGGPALAVYTGDPLQYDASLVTEEGGHRGVTLSRIVETAERVDELMARARGRRRQDPRARPHRGVGRLHRLLRRSRRQPLEGGRRSVGMTKAHCSSTKGSRTDD